MRGQRAGLDDNLDVQRLGRTIACDVQRLEKLRSADTP